MAGDFACNTKGFDQAAALVSITIKASDLPDLTDEEFAAKCEWRDGMIQLKQPPQPDLVNHPPHYTSGISDFGRRVLVECFDVDAADLDRECIDFILFFIDNSSYLSEAPTGEGFLAGNAIKYLWRTGLKGDAVQDLRKAAFYLDRWDAEGFAGECFSMNDAAIMVFAEIDRLEAVEAATAGYSEGLGGK
jgi:hypothetical protein